jgi:hypothetical protein
MPRISDASVDRLAIALRRIDERLRREAKELAAGRASGSERPQSPVVGTAGGNPSKDAA